ncbi:MAG TPA: PAS domain-containing sensor histidine kinase [Pseudolabrys sp.]|nr:PAS domain-containing sensor histidine kinase [Pseudolabrys sp.]
MTADQAVNVETVVAEPVPRRSNVRIVGPILVAVAMLSAVITFLVLAGLTPIVPTHYVVVTLLLVNAVAGALLLGVIGREVWQILRARQTGRAGARLHIRIVGLFSVIAAVPAILVAVVASITLDRGLDSLFASRMREAIENSVVVAQAYLRDHAQTARSDIMLMAFDLARNKDFFEKNAADLQQFLTFQAAARGLAAIVEFDGNLTVTARAKTSATQVFSLPPREALTSITETEPQIVLLPDANYVAAVVKLRDYDDRYLYVARLLDPRVLPQLRATEQSAGEYAALAARRVGVQVAFALMYTVIALIVLLSAVWIGLDFANRLVAPIGRLINAATAVTAGNLFVRVPVRRSEGDLANLGETFNRMTQELRTQRDDIVRARDQIDTRRRFTEAVLSGASAGVIGIDPHGRITILNRSAEKLVDRTESEALGHTLHEILPELDEFMRQAQAAATLRPIHGQIKINRAGEERTISLRVTSEQSAAAEHGYVVTLDDITELVSAQRTSAWADVARRIAHEIKNPLTPIQLSAERLRRKYGNVIIEDRDVFEQCTSTIVRQVDDIKRMVDEFSRFARTPKAEFAVDDVADTVRQVVFLMRVGHADIDFELSVPDEPMQARFDRRLISQALTNIVKNATEAIGAVPQDVLGKGRIVVTAARDGNDIVIDVVDNGLGLPKENRNRLLEPYVTTREKGTGLGLAIVGRILEEHGGGIELRDAADKFPGQRGAWMRMRFASESVAKPDAETKS